MECSSTRGTARTLWWWWRVDFFFVMGWTVWVGLGNLGASQNGVRYWGWWPTGQLAAVTPVTARSVQPHILHLLCIEFISGAQCAFFVILSFFFYLFISVAGVSHENSLKFFDEFSHLLLLGTYLPIYIADDFVARGLEAAPKNPRHVSLNSIKYLSLLSMTSIECSLTQKSF